MHRYPVRNFRPNVDEEYNPAKAAVESSGTNMNRVLRAVMRWIATDPAKAMKTLAPHLAAVDKDTDPNDVGRRGGRPPKKRDQSPT